MLRVINFIKVITLSKNVDYFYVIFYEASKDTQRVQTEINRRFHKYIIFQ